MKKFFLTFLFIFLSITTAHGDDGGWSPVGLGITEDFQFPKKESDVYGLRVGVYENDNRNVYGLDVSVFNTEARRVSGVQLGFYSNVHYFEGIQIVYGNEIPVSSLKGIQVSGISFIEELYGVQVSLGGVVWQPIGIQISGLMTMGVGGAGLQVAGIGNSTCLYDRGGFYVGIQVAGIVNSGCNVRGLQIALFNIVSTEKTEDNFKATFKGVQVGVLNRADNVTGLQIGVFNYAKTMKGIQIGLINIIRSNETFTFMPILNARF